MSSRRTSDKHDELSKQDGFSGGKKTTFKADEPDFSLDYNDAAAALPGLVEDGAKRYSSLLADGAKPAKGSSRNQYGFLTGSDFADYGGAGGVGKDFAAMLRPEGDGLSVWTVKMISADSFQTANRSGASGKNDDGNSGYLFYEDRRNPKYSIAAYEKVGTVPAAKVYSAWKGGLIQTDLAQKYLDQNPLYKAELDAIKAKEQMAAQAILDTIPKRPIPTWEFTKFPGGYQVARSPGESSDPNGAHPGENITGLNFLDVSGGQTPAKLGLPLPLVSKNDQGQTIPANEDVRAAIVDANRGDQRAQAALADVGIPWAQGQTGDAQKQYGSWLDGLGAALGGLFDRQNQQAPSQQTMPYLAPVNGPVFTGPGKGADHF